IASILACELSLGAVAKARDIIYENDRVFVDGRILTDLRPVFRANASDPPLAGVVVHTLRITYCSSEGHRRFYAVLDLDDLKKLKTVIERAIQKDNTIRKMADSAKLAIFSSYQEE